MQTLAITAIISLTLYLLMSYLIVPIWKRYHRRYSSYLPIERISSQTNSLQQRIQATVMNYLIPSSWRSQFLRSRHLSSADEMSDFDEDDGEELYEVDSNRREALSLDSRRGRSEVGTRLSRDLEEGFMDDTDSESEENIHEQNQNQPGARWSDWYLTDLYLLTKIYPESVPKNGRCCRFSVTTLPTISREVIN